MERKRKCRNKDCTTNNGYFRPQAGTPDYVKWCSQDCQDAIIEKSLAKERVKRERSQKRSQAAQKKKERRQKRAYTADKLSHQIDLTQAQFNGLIVLLDKDEPCGSCGRYKCGSGWDCGHVKSRGSHPELRFDFLNAWKQGSACNRANVRMNSRSVTVSKQYEERLAKTKGQWVVDYLNGPHEAKHYTREGLKVLRAEFAAERRYIGKHGEPSRDWRELNDN